MAARVAESATPFVASEAGYCRPAWGPATVSSIAVAHEVAAMGGTAIACLNARDRNVLGFQRDLLTAAAYGVEKFLFVYGDRPETGRRSIDFEGAVYAGVMVVASAAMARKLTATIPQLAVPAHVLTRLEGDGDAGVDMACDLLAGIRDSGAFDGVHLVPVSRYREVARRLETLRGR